MTPELWQKVGRAFAQAAELTPSERTPFLQKLHQDDAAVGAEVASLLRQEDPPESTLLGGVPSPVWQRIAGSESQVWPAQVGPFQIEEQVGEGGMGIVFRARDPIFHRTLAVKVLAERWGADADLKRRFLEEAQLMGQLQHPGVPPVHALGELPDGRPYFAMKLIKGQTLATLLEQKDPSPRMSKANPGGRADLPRWIAIFEQICQTMAYAHSRAIIHRDLKPANIMVGAFGEVQVMDWGLAKVLASGGRQPPDASAQEASAIFTARTMNADADTQPGQAIGTRAYMPPEQARGDSVDARADVFGLGGILCVMLTGQPPFAPSKRQHINRLAMQGDLGDAFARLDGCGADGELIDLAKKCLAPERDDRPASAAVVAEVVGTYRRQVQERLQQAEIERSRAEVQVTEERKRRQIEEQKAAAEQAKAREERKRRRVTVALAASLLAVVLVAGAGLWAWQHQQTVRGAEKSTQAALTRQTVESSLEQLKALHKRALWKEADALLVQAENQLGPEGDEELRAKVAQARRDTAFIKRLDAIRLDKSLVVERKMNFAGALPKYREAFQENGFDILQGDPAELAAKLNESSVRDYVVAALDDWTMEEGDTGRKRILGVTAKATGQQWRIEMSAVWKDGTKLAELFDAIPLHQRTPGIILAVGLRLGHLGKEGIRRIEDGLRQHPGDFWLHFELGRLGGKERLDAQVGAYRAALAIRPDTAVVHYNLGLVLYDKKEYDAAIAAFNEAIRLDPTSAVLHNALGVVLLDKKEHSAAITAFKEAIRLDPKFADPHHNLGNLLRRNKEYDAAIAAYKEAIRLDPKYAVPHNGLGNVLADKKEYHAAIAAYKEAIRLDPKEGRSHYNLGNVFYAKKEYGAAIAAFSEAIHLDPKYALPHYALGVVLLDKKEYSAAITAFKEAIRLDPKEARYHNDLGKVLSEKNDFHAAIPVYKEAIRLDPSLAFPHANLGLVYRKLGRFADSAQSLREAARLVSNHPVIEEQLRISTQLLAQDEHLVAIRNGTAHAKTPAEAIRLADFAMQEFKKEYALAFRLFTEAFAADPKLITKNRYNAACVAIQLAAGKDVRVQPAVEEWHYLQHEARMWLAADFDVLRKNASSDQAGKLLQTLSHWLQDPDLLSVRELSWLNAMPDAERQAWQKLWADADQLLKETRAASTETTQQGALTGKDPEKVHELKVAAGNSYVIDMTSEQFDTYLRLEDAEKTVLGENDDIDAKSKNLNSRIVFTPREDGVYRIIATSFQQRGIGAYTLIIREFQPKKK